MSALPLVVVGGTGGSSPAARMFDVDTLEQRESTLPSASDLAVATYSPDGRYLWLQQRYDGVVDGNVYETATWEPVYTEGFAIRRIAFSPDSRHMALGGSAVAIRNAEDGSFDSLYSGSLVNGSGVSFRPDGARALFSAGLNNNGFYRVVNTETMATDYFKSLSLTGVWHTEYCADGSKIVVCRNGSAPTATQSPLIFLDAATGSTVGWMSPGSSLGTPGKPAIVGDYIVVRHASALRVIDAVSMTLVASVGGGVEPVYDPLRNCVWYLSAYGGTVRRLDMETLTVTDVPLDLTGLYPLYIAPPPNTGPVIPDAFWTNYQRTAEIV